MADVVFVGYTRCGVMVILVSVCQPPKHTGMNIRIYIIIISTIKYMYSTIDFKIADRKLNAPSALSFNVLRL